MDTIRPLRDDDLHAIAGLFLRIFRRTDAPPPAGLTAYFREIYAENPWHRTDVPSLVYESGGEPVGFLGAIPFPMTVGDRRILAVIGGNYMMDTRRADPLAGVKLLKRLLSGPQDVTYSDTATEAAVRIWRGLGSETLPVYSMQWLKVFRPSRFAAMMATRNTPAALLATLTAPVTWAVDRMLTALPSSPVATAPVDARCEPLTTEELERAYRAVAAARMLRPDHDGASFRWLVEQAHRKTEFGPLRSAAVRSPQGTFLGHFLYYPNTGSLGHVLQLVAEPRNVPMVAAALMADAAAEGSLAVEGRLEALHIPHLSALHCIFMQRNSYTVVHTRDADVLKALRTGDAMFTRLEGEWWTRLQGDDVTAWSDPGAASSGG